MFEELIKRKYSLHRYDLVENTIEEAFKLKTRSVVIAKKQEYGIAQYGRVWSHEEGNNLLISVHEDKMLNIYEANSILAFASWKTLNQYLSNTFTIKHPNDLYYKDKKIGGVISHYRKKSAVYSAGINLNSYSTILNSISLSQILNETIDIDSFIRLWLYNYFRTSEVRLNSIEMKNILKSVC